MADISMCHNGSECPLRKSCFRFTAKPGEWQAMSDFYKTDKECEHYWEVKSETEYYKLMEVFDD